MEGPVYPPSPTAKRPTNPWVWVAVGCLVAIVVLAVGAGLCFYFGFVRNPEIQKTWTAMMQEAEHINTSQANLKAIGEAMQRYAQKNEGEYPEKLADLKDEYLTDPDVLINPSTKHEYTYNRPETDAPDDTPVITVVHQIPGAPQTVELLKDGTVVLR